MKNKKVIISLGVIVMSVLAYLVFNEMNKGSEPIEDNAVAPSLGDETVTTMLVFDEVRVEPVEKEFPFSMSELEVQIAIHGMSHQKVRASNDEKWDLLLMTPERIDRLIVVVEANNVQYRQNVDTYLAILNRWKNNDFSRVDLDHNLVWEIQEGTRGRAIGIFTLEEEKAFIEEHYNVEVREVTSDN